ncbi:MAG: YolD-like family protein [Bacteroidales bacterium]|nr:YolD-like family protein [Bacteroidales bacterium]
MNRYEDIINIPHWEPRSHPRMSEYDRAAQFAPFAALTGYDAMVKETSRLTDDRDELDEERILALNETLSLILERLSEHPEISMTWFKKDMKKQGGAYVKTAGSVRDVDLAGRQIVLKDGKKISLDDITSITILK